MLSLGYRGSDLSFLFGVGSGVLRPSRLNCDPGRITLHDKQNVCGMVPKTAQTHVGQAYVSKAQVCAFACYRTLSPK